MEPACLLVSNKKRLEIDTTAFERVSRVVLVFSQSCTEWLERFVFCQQVISLKECFAVRPDDSIRWSIMLTSLCLFQKNFRASRATVCTIEKFFESTVRANNLETPWPTIITYADAVHSVCLMEINFAPSHYYFDNRQRSWRYISLKRTLCFFRKDMNYSFILLGR